MRDMLVQQNRLSSSKNNRYNRGPAGMERTAGKSMRQKQTGCEEQRPVLHRRSTEMAGKGKRTTGNLRQKAVHWILQAVILPLVMEAGYLIVWNIREKKKRNPRE